MNLEQIGEKLFKPFKRFTDVKKGLGLGLYMIKVQVKTMQEEMHVKSATGAGITYNIEFKNPSRQPG